MIQRYGIFINTEHHFQKSYTTDFLTKKKKINEGEIPQYYVENAHPPIIEPAVYDTVQQELQRRKTGENRHSGVGLFASRIKCGKCGSWYGAKVWHSTSKYRRVIYRCNRKFDGGDICNTPHLTEEEIKAAFISAANILIAGKDTIIADYNAIKTQLFDTVSLEKERGDKLNEAAAAAEFIQKCIEENARVAFDQTEYEKHYAALTERYNAVKKQLDDMDNKISEKKSRKKMMEKFLSDLAAREELLTEFDEGVWVALLDYATVGKDGRMVFTFKNGAVINADI